MPDLSRGWISRETADEIKGRINGLRATYRPGLLDEVANLYALLDSLVLDGEPKIEYGAYCYEAGFDCLGSLEATQAAVADEEATCGPHTLFRRTSSPWVAVDPAGEGS